MHKPVVLIVEGEALIRLSAVHIVQGAGYAAVEAADAAGAIAVLERRKDIRAVFTDIRMSGSMDGLRLAHAIRGRWPPIHLLLASGSNVPIGADLPANGRFILKPYSAEQVVAALHEFFDPIPAPRRLRAAGTRTML